MTKVKKRGEKTTKVNDYFDDESDEPLDENVLEDAEYSPKSDFNKATLVQSAISRVVESRSKEMRSGYYNTLTLPNGSVKKQYFPDTRKEFISSVEALKSVLSPEIATNEETKRFLTEFEKKKQILFDEYATQKVRVTPMGLDITDIKYIPEVDEDFPINIIVVDNSGSTKRRIDFKRGYWNFEVKQYWDKMVLLYDELYAQLNILIALKNYFKQGTSY